MARSPTPALQPAAAPAPTAPSNAAARARTGSRLRTTLRHSLPVLGVVVVVVLVAAIAYVVYDANRKGARTLSNDLITAIDRRVGAQMRSYLSPPQQFLTLADAAAAGRSVIERGARNGTVRAPCPRQHPVRLGASATPTPRATIFSSMRNDKGGFDTKTIDRREGGDASPGRGATARTRRSSSRRIQATRSIRARGPGTRARKARGSRSGPTPTCSSRCRSLASRWRSRISTATASCRPSWPSISRSPRSAPILEQLSIGSRGRALIVDRTGRIIAYPDDKWLPANDPEAKAPRLDEIGDPVLTRAYDLLRVEGYGRKVLDFGHERIIVSSEPVRRLTSRDWVVLIVVPETDFVGFVADSGITALVMSVGVVLIVAGLTGLLAWRNVQAERRAAAATTRQQALETRTQTFIDLAHDAVAADAEEAVSPGRRESAATACAAKRVAIWRLSRDGRTLTCEDCFDSTVQ